MKRPGLKTQISPKTKRSKKEAPTNPAPVTRLPQYHPAISIPSSLDSFLTIKKPPEIGALVAVFINAKNCWLLGNVVSNSTLLQKATVFLFEEQSTLFLHNTELLHVNLQLLKDEFSPRKEPEQWRPSPEESDNLIQAFGTDQPFEIIPWAITEVGMIVQRYISPVDLLSCYFVCLSWKLSIEKVWNEDQRRLAIIQTAYETVNSKIEAETKALEVIKLVDFNAQDIRACRPDAKKTTAEERAERFKAQSDKTTEIEQLKKTSTKLSERLAEQTRILWFKDQPKELQQQTQFILPYPASPLPSFKYYVTSENSDTLPPEFATCTKIDSLAKAIEDCPPGGIIYLAPTTFTFAKLTWFKKNLQLIGTGDLSRITVSPRTPSHIKLTCCDVVFRNLSLDYPGRISVITGNLWIENCKLDFTNSMTVSFRSNIFLSKTTFMSFASPALEIEADTVSVVTENTKFLSSKQPYGDPVAISVCDPKGHSKEITVQLCLKYSSFSAFNHIVALLGPSKGLVEHLKDHVYCEGDFAKPPCDCEKMGNIICEIKQE